MPKSSRRSGKRVTRGETLRVVIETPRGSRIKYAWEPDESRFLVKKLLPHGMVFPFDFGFIPDAMGGDGDPLDVLVLMDEPAYPGSIVECRLIGAIMGVDVKGAKRERNDRLIAVAEETSDYADILDIRDLGKRVREIVHFFESYPALRGKTFKVSSVRGAQGAGQVLQKARETSGVG